MNRRKICVVTTSRADFGLLRGLLQAIQSDRRIQLQLIVSGMHLSPEFGLTWREIESEGFRIDRKINLHLTGKSSEDNLNSLRIGLQGFSKALKQLRPQILVLLGDRFELFPSAIAALMLRIPIAHIHGGELSEGVLDDTVRHAITKMAFLHFPATAVYRKRIIQMGESPNRVFNFGAPGLDQLHGAKLLSRQELENDLGFPLDSPIALVTFHPAAGDASGVRAQLDSVLSAIKATGIKCIFTMANADAHGALINARLRTECAKNPSRFHWAPHLGHRRYLSCLKYVSLMVGNSSSGITEAPSFRLPVVNIGDRQQGRVRAANIIDVPCTPGAIRKGIRKALSLRFRASLKGLRNPYDRFHDGRTSERIKNILKQTPLSPDSLKKSFHDLR